MKYKTALIVLMVFGALFDPLAGKDTWKIMIINAQGRMVQLNVEIADNEPLMTKGLMHRKEMAQDRGMLFVFDREQILNFWMKNTFIPLSIAYIGKTGVINEIHDMKPLDISVTYPSVMPAQYALEVNRGWFAQNKITKGCRIVLDGCISK
jgi:uncharacterized protein